MPSSPPRAMRRWIPDAVGGLAAIVYALPSLAYPFGMDQPVHWYIARRWLEGLTPYAQSMDTKPPGVFAVHALSILAFGNHPWGVRVVDLGFVLAAGALIATFRARRSMDARVVDVVRRAPGELGAACLAVSALAYTFFDWTALGHSDLWQGVLMLMAGWVVVRAPDGVVSPRRAMAAGAVTMAAITLKHSAAVSLGLGALIVVMLLLERRPRAAAIAGLAYGGGAACVLAVTILPFALTGTLGPLREAMVDLIVRYAEVSADTPSDPDSWPTHAHGLLPLLLASGMALGGLAVTRLDRDRAAQRVSWMVLVVLACGVASVELQMRARVSGFSYHWLASIPALALAIAWGLRSIIPKSGVSQLAAIAALTAIAFFAGPEWLTTPLHDYRAEWRARWGVVTGELAADEAARAYHAHQPMVDSYLWQRVTADRIRELARPGDTLCLDGYFGAIHQLTGLDCPSRHFIPPGALDGALASWFEEHERMFEEDPPTFFVTVSNREAVLQRRLAQGYVLHEASPPMRFRLVILERR